MTSSTPTRTTGRRSRTVGLVLVGLVAVFLAVDAATHLVDPAFVQESFATLGYPAWVARFSGGLELVFVVLLVVPRTRLLGALFLTAYLGGVFATQVRVEAPVVSTMLFSVYLAVALWVGLLLHDPRLRDLLGVR
jgi:hypothetical protein